MWQQNWKKEKKNKNKKTTKKVRERKKDDEKENKLRTLLYSCNIIFCWEKIVPLSFLFFTHPECKQVSPKGTYFIPHMFAIVHCLRSRLWEWVQDVHVELKFFLLLLLLLLPPPPSPVLLLGNLLIVYCLR